MTVKVKLEPTVGLDALSETTVVEPERVGTLEPTVTGAALPEEPRKLASPL